MIALLAPGVAVHVVAVGFAEAAGVGVHEADAADPFGGFPEVEVGTTPQMPSNWRYIDGRNKR